MKHLSRQILMICLSLDAALGAPSAFAGTSGSFDDAVVEAKAPCTHCGSIRVQPVKPIIVPKPAIPRPPAPIPSLRVSFNNSGGKAINSQCRKFIDGNGNYGEFGQQISKLMANNFGHKHFTHPKSLKAFCPNFDKFENDEIKLKAWTWFWMVLANEESDCTVKYLHTTHTKSGRRINPVQGYGLFAAELSPSMRAARPMCSGDITTAKVQIMCAVGTMVDTALGKGFGVFRPDGYWGPTKASVRWSERHQKNMKRHDFQIKPNMRGFKPCFSH